MNCSQRKLGRQWRKIKSHQWCNNEGKILKRSGYIQFCPNSSRNWTEMEVFLFHYLQRRNHLSLGDLPNLWLQAWLLIPQSLGMRSLQCFFYCDKWFLNAYKLNMIWVVWFSLASSVKISRIFDCLPLVFCLIEIWGSCVEREAFSKTLSQIGH